jgi:hypothetical protein
MGRVFVQQLEITFVHASSPHRRARLNAVNRATATLSLKCAGPLILSLNAAHTTWISLALRSREATKALLLGGTAGVAGLRTASTSVAVRLPARWRLIVFTGGRSDRKKVDLSRPIPIAWIVSSWWTQDCSLSARCTISLATPMDFETKTAE